MALLFTHVFLTFSVASFILAPCSGSTDYRDNDTGSLRDIIHLQKCFSAHDQKSAAFKLYKKIKAKYQTLRGKYENLKTKYKDTKRRHSEQEETIRKLNETLQLTLNESSSKCEIPLLISNVSVVQHSQNGSLSYDGTDGDGLPSHDGVTTDGNGFEFDQMPEGVRKAFMTVKQVIQFVDKTDSNYRISSTVIYNDVETLLKDPHLGYIARDVLPTLPDGTWKSMKLIYGCCPVLKFMATNKTLVNLNGVERRIVHFVNSDPPKYQFIQHGICATDGKVVKSHTCVQGFQTMTVLVWDTRYNPPYALDMFDIPSHCACYNN